MAPPLLPEKVQLVTMRVSLIPLAMAPPPWEKLVLFAEKVQLVTVRKVPFSLRMAPPSPPVLLPEKVLLVAVPVPAMLSAAPPGSTRVPKADPLAMVRFSTVNVTPEFTENTPTVPPPLMVIMLPPSMVVLALMVFVVVTVIVAAPPQAKVTVPSKLPPPGRQAFNAASVQLALVPVPTTHAKADEVAANIAKTSSARTSTSCVRTVVVLIAYLRC